MSEEHTFFSDIESAVGDVPEDSIVSRTLLTKGTFRVVMFGFAPGEELTEHTSAQDAVLHFLSGEAVLTLGDESMAVQAGSWVHMPPNMAHSIKAKTPTKMMLLLFKPGDN